MRLRQALAVAALAECAGLALPLAAQSAPGTPPEPPAQVPETDASEALELPLHSARIYAVPPRFAYPPAALRDDIEGRCMVHFTIDAAGVPQDIRPDCSHPLFTAPAREGVAAMRMIVGGDIAGGERFRLPVSFRIPL